MHHDKKPLNKKIGYLLFGLVGIFFAFCLITGSALAREGNIVWTPARTAAILSRSFLSGGIAGVLFSLIVCENICGRLKNRFMILYRNVFPRPVRFVPERVRRGIDRWQACSDGRVFGMYLFLIFAAWIPYFLAYFPGICAYDAVTQIGQIESGEYVEHHPLAHTLWIRACLWLGRQMSGNANGGAALYTLLQMLFLAAAMAYGIVLLRRYGVKPVWQIIFLLFSMFYPFHGYLSVSMTKDVIFTSFFLFQVLSLFGILKSGGNDFLLKKSDILFFISTVGMILFRNNGQYAVLVMVLFLPAAIIFGGKGRRKLPGRLFLECMAALAAGNILLWVLSASVDAVQGDRREMLSMPIQQLARCMLYHGGAGVYPEDDNTMAREDKELIKELFMEDGYLGYSPHISDPVKSRTLTSVIRYQPKRFAASYLGLLADYPGDFVNAALEVNAGYLYINDESHSSIYQEMYPGMEGKGYVQTQWWESVVEKTGVYKDTKWPALYHRLERWADENAYLKHPLFRYFFVPGIWLWWCLLLLCTLLVRREYRFCLPLLLVLGYFATLLLGPVVQLRYIYPVMVSIPGLTLLTGRNTAEG